MVLREPTRLVVVIDQPVFADMDLGGTQLLTQLGLADPGGRTDRPRQA